MSANTPLQKLQDVSAPFADGSLRFVADGQGVIIHVTEALAVKLGVPVPSLVGQMLTGVLEFLEPDEVFHAGGLFGAAKNTSYIDSLREGAHDVVLTSKGETAAMRFDRVRAADGQRFLIGSFEADNEQEADDDVLARHLSALLASRDEQKTATGLSFQTAESELVHFLDLSHEVMAVSASNGRIGRVNDAFHEVLGFGNDQLQTMKFSNLVHPADRDRICDLMEKNSGEGQIIDFEARMQAGDGSVKWMQWRQKSVQGRVYSVGRDLTSVKAHEAALQTQARHLSEAQAIAHMGHWHWTVGEETIVFSDEIYRIFGCDRDTFVPSLDNMNAMLNRRDVGRLLQAFQRAIIERNDYDMEFRVQRPDGEMRTIRCEGRCEIDSENEVVALFGIMQDVTERTQHEAQLRQAKESAERAYAAKSQFLANMSHELRTPLNAIIGFSEMMERQLLGPLGTPRYLDYIAGIRESGEHLLDLISDILNMSKIEAGKYELDLEELNPAKVIRLAAHMIEGRAQESRITVTVDIESDEQQIVADRRALMQILLNLLSNAIKFTDPGGLVHVTCLPRADNDTIAVRVQDTGIGIPANMLSTIARPFEQGANHYSRDHEGTGLGLAITKELVELHGGAMFIESTVGIGTTVTIRLPCNAYAHVKARRKEKS